MGCIARLGCLVLLVLLAAVGWWQRDRWLPRVRGSAGSRDSSAVVTSGEGVWQPLTTDGGERARRALEDLRRPNGPTSVTVRVADLGAYVYQELARQLPPSADSVETTAIGDQLHVRASVRLRELGGREVLGPLATMLGERERLELGGNLRVVRPGLAELVVREIRVGQLRVPSAVIPRLLRQSSRRERPEGISESGLPLRIPEHIGDIRVAGGSVTIYRAPR
jgi:pimeloyl-ACP methyl ester carboxylesterase